MITLASALLGVVLIGPVCPGPEIEGKPCPSIPWAAVRVRLSPEGELAGRQPLEVSTDAQGRFSAPALGSGAWRVEVLVGKPTRCLSQLIQIPRPAGAPPLTLECDSGRR
ncbi:MAG: hypothetical protein J0L58_07765 [Burkholderiales bacterium]|uniref:hypothetical protein n=1 Tax=Inhella sp. TaxID=1921806 RepID=UPI001AC7B2DA|nr:hypothetical protein [Burkholderiales bacterium]